MSLRTSTGSRGYLQCGGSSPTRALPYGAYTYISSHYTVNTAALVDAKVVVFATDHSALRVLLNDLPAKKGARCECHGCCSDGEVVRCVACNCHWHEACMTSEGCPNCVMPAEKPCRQKRALSQSERPASPPRHTQCTAQIQGVPAGSDAEKRARIENALSPCGSTADPDTEEWCRNVFDVTVLIPN